MSRIDEALRRAQSPLSGRGSSRGVDSPIRLADDFTINEYPQEGRGSSVRVDPPAARHDHAPHPPGREEVRPRTRMVHLDSNEKLVAGSRRNSVSTEQYRRLAATLHDAQVDKGLKTVMVTSAVPREGKTLTAVNLALTLSESYRRRVLLIDADLRRPSVHELIGIANDRGLTDVLRTGHLEALAVETTTHLSVLPSGRTDENPLAGLSSERMRTLLDDAQSRYDWVLLDTPPVGLLPDAHVISRLAQAVVFVIRAGYTPFASVERAVSELGREIIIGTVLNGVDQRAIPASRYDYGHYYGQGGGG